MSHSVIVLGAGGHAKVVVSTLQAAGHEVVGLFDDNAARIGTQVLGVPVLGPVSAATSAVTRHAIIGIGDNRTRQQLAAQLQLDWFTVVHPRAYVHESVVLGAGTVVFAGAIIQPDTVIGSHAILNTASSVDHDCRLEDFVHVAPGAHLSGGVTVGEGAFLGVGSSVLPGRSVGNWVVVGGGGAVVHDPLAGTTVVGVPARSIRR